MTEIIVSQDAQALMNKWLEQEKQGTAMPVPFDEAWPIVGYARKDHAKRKLTSKNSGLVEGEDFAFLRSGEWKQDGRSSDLIYMTCDAFKEFCLMARTDVGKATRLYFIQCEKQLREAQSPTTAIDRIPENRPVSRVDYLIEMAYALKDHDDRLVSLEAENRNLMQALEKAYEFIKETKHIAEAAVMETEANTAELERFRNGHGYYYTIAGWCKKHGHKRSSEWIKTQGRKAAALCRQRGILPQPMNDPRWGAVNSYPDSVLMELDWS